MSLSPKFLVATAATTIAAAAAATIAYGANNAESQFFGRTLVAPPYPDQLALTFDDGPNPSATPRLLEILARRGVRATFFLLGDFVLREPALTREIAAAGHVVGNHTMSHPFLPRQTPARIQAELAGCNRVLEDTLGTPITLFRPPHGGRSPAVFAAAAALGLTTVQWNLMVDDWTPVSSAIILDRMEQGLTRNRRRRRGTNIVLHDGGQAGLGQPRLPTVEAVEALLTRLPPQTRFVTPRSASE